MAGTPHSMPFGAEVLVDGGVRFRLWAPAKDQVQLNLHHGSGLQQLAMQPAVGGWHECITADAAAGTDYTFRIETVAGEYVDVPDPASRYQPHDVHGPSRVIDPARWQWQTGNWRGRPWHEAVIYELHVGTFSPSGDFAGVRERLGHLEELGVTAIELMPVADFPGARNWGYDGVCPFAPDASYGTLDDLKALIDAAHAHNLMVFLDVVYNHFGPEGNYLHAYAPQFFNERHQTPWGAAINFDAEQSHWVREFFIHNAIYWLREYCFDGLRFDAVHAIADDSTPHILVELADRVYSALGPERQIHLMLENDHNEAHFLRRSDDGQRSGYVAQWNDDMHHAMHSLLTAERGGYYVDYSDDPVAHLGRCLTEGFAYQGESSRYRNGAPRGESTAGLPTTAFIPFLQNHDQIGNRAMGDRISTLADEQALRAMTALLLLAPSPPLLFMGQEWNCKRPFLFFCDFEAELSAKVVEGRRREFSSFPEFADPERQALIPDPTVARTFRASVLDWSEPATASGRSWLELHRQLLAIRRRALAPRLATIKPGVCSWQRLTSRALRAEWLLGGDSRLTMLANLGPSDVSGIDAPTGTPIYAVPDWPPEAAGRIELPGWCVAVFLDSG
jgi:maltooligosyltrehalose trehalohydrolase